jgi:hypothetical protein
MIMSISRFDLSPERVSRQHCAKQIKLLHCAYMSRPRDDMHDGYGVLASNNEVWSLHTYLWLSQWLQPCMHAVVIFIPFSPYEHEHACCFKALHYCRTNHMYMYVDTDGWLTWESEVNETITNGDVYLASGIPGSTDQLEGIFISTSPLT